jgi:hypothetical protein
MQSKPVFVRKRNESAGAESGAVEDDVWAWGVIFTAAGVTALCVAMLFSVGTG